VADLLSSDGAGVDDDVQKFLQGALGAEAAAPAPDDDYLSILT
jgi:hypothetical protein